MIFIRKDDQTTGYSEPTKNDGLHLRVDSLAKASELTAEEHGKHRFLQFPEAGNPSIHGLEVGEYSICVQSSRG